MGLDTIGNIAQFLGSAVLVYSYFPQIYKLFKSKNASGMNLQFWTILTIGLTCIAINLSIVGVQWFIQFTQWFNVILAFIVLVLSIKYKGMAKRAAN
ncbi:MAG: PQ-loop domain-containing transporter [Sarcina sp.]